MTKHRTLTEWLDSIGWQGWLDYLKEWTKMQQFKNHLPKEERMSESFKDKLRKKFKDLGEELENMDDIDEIEGEIDRVYDDISDIIEDAKQGL